MAAATATRLVQPEGAITDVLMPITSGESDFGGFGDSEDVLETVVLDRAGEGPVVKENLTVEDALERGVASGEGVESVDVAKELTPEVRSLSLSAARSSC
jgi:hypothetical protein